jgi:hypothetical protein
LGHRGAFPSAAFAALPMTHVYALTHQCASA